MSLIISTQLLIYVSQGEACYTIATHHESMQKDSMMQPITETYVVSWGGFYSMWAGVDGCITTENQPVKVWRESQLDLYTN